jgi:hypothetical protein
MDSFPRVYQGIGIESDKNIGVKTEFNKGSPIGFLNA